MFFGFLYLYRYLSNFLEDLTGSDFSLAVLILLPKNYTKIRKFLPVFFGYLKKKNSEFHERVGISTLLNNTVV